MAIGFEPLVDTLILTKGSDFIHEIFPAGESFPVGTTVELVIYRVPTGEVLATWDAAISPSVASWDISSTVADTITLPANFRIYVHYSDGADFCWYRGHVARKE